MFVLSKDVDHLEYSEYLLRENEYSAYLDSIRECLLLDPPNFIFEDWYKNTQSHKCLHDSWLVQLVIGETQEKEVFIELKLLGAYHDGYITLRYSDVQYYDLKRHKDSVILGAHGDLRYEEFRLDKEGNMIHEFDWYTLNENGIYLIACKKISYCWEDLPKDEEINREPKWSTNENT